LVEMSRALAKVAGCVVCVCVCAGAVAADRVDSVVRDMSDASYKVRLAAALALAKSRDPRAVIALAEAVTHDDEPTIRRIAALSLEKMIDARTADDARDIAFAALDKAAKSDADESVREAAERTRKSIERYRRTHQGNATPPRGDRPAVFVHIDPAIDPSRTLPSETTSRVSSAVKRNVEAKTGYATSWPGGLPTSAELTTSKARAFIVASTVKKVDIKRNGGQTAIACTVTIRVAPWSGKDGGEKWEANKVATASGSARATTGSSPRDVNGGVKDCLDAVAEDVTARQVVPFLKRIAAGG
jgi:hypothetical protein